MPPSSELLSAEIPEKQGPEIKEQIDQERDKLQSNLRDAENFLDSLPTADELREIDPEKSKAIREQVRRFSISVRDAELWGLTAFGFALGQSLESIFEQAASGKTDTMDILVRVLGLPLMMGLIRRIHKKLIKIEVINKFYKEGL